MALIPMEYEGGVLYRKYFFDSTHPSIGAQNTWDKTIDISLTGYTPLGIVESGIYQGYLCSFGFAFLDGTTARLRVTNPSTGSQTIGDVFIAVLYQKN